MSVQGAGLMPSFQPHLGGQVRRASESDPHALHQMAQQMRLLAASAHPDYYNLHGRDDDVFSGVGGGFELLPDADHSEQLDHYSNNTHCSPSKPSWSLTVRNVAPDTSKDELQSIFQAFGLVHTLFMANGVVLVTYFDLRASTAAQRSLNGTLLSNLPLDIQFYSPENSAQDINQGTIIVFNMDPGTTNDHLAWLYSKFGEVKDVTESPMRPSQKFVTFYDIRHAAAALEAISCAENLGKLPGHLTMPPQQAAPLARRTGSSGSLSSLAQGQGRAGSCNSLEQLALGGHGSQPSEGGAPLGPNRGSANHFMSLGGRDGHTSGSVEDLLSRLNQQQAQQLRQGGRSTGYLGGMSGAGGGSMGGGGMGGSMSMGCMDAGLGVLNRVGGSPLGCSPTDSFAGPRANLRFGSQGDLATSPQSQFHKFHNPALHELSANTSSRSIHISDSASSISAAAAAAGNGHSHFYGSGTPGAAGPMLGGSGSAYKGVQISGPMSAAAVTGSQALGMMSQLPHQHVGMEAYMQPASSAVDRQAQQLLVQSGMSPNEAAEMLMALNLSQPQYMGPAQHGGAHHKPHYGMWAGGHGHLNPIVEGSEGASTSAPAPSASPDAESAMASHLAGLMLQQRQQQSFIQQQQQQQQQQVAFAHHLASLQAPQQQAALGGGGGGNNQHLAQAQQLLHVAQLNQAMAHIRHPSGNNGGSCGGAPLLSQQQQVLQAQQQNAALASSLAAVQLLQQAGMGFEMSPNPLAYHLAASQMAAAMAGRFPLAGQMAGQAQQQGGVAAGGGEGGDGSRCDYPAAAAAGAATTSASAAGGASDGSRNGGRLSRRTTDPAAEVERKAQQEKLYALDNDRIRCGEDRRTTLMIKNIPNKYTQKMLLATIDEHFRGSYDFFYLPIDFKNKCNVGYAFINMIQPINIIPLVQRFNHKKWERFNSEKVCHISYARIQGRSSLVAHFQNSSLMHEDKRCRPILFSLDGVQVGEQEPFPHPGSGGVSSAGGSTNSLSGLAASGGGSGGGGGSYASGGGGGHASGGGASRPLSSPNLKLAGSSNSLAGSSSGGGAKQDGGSKTSGKDGSAKH